METEAGISPIASLKAAIDSLPPWLSQAEADALYAFGYAHLVQGRYDKAHDVFRSLMVVDPSHRSYIAGLAIALQRLERYDEALTINAAALVWHPTDLHAMLRSGECLLALQRRTDAITQLDRIVAGCAEMADGHPDPERQAVAERAAAMRQLLTTVIEGTP